MWKRLYLIAILTTGVINHQRNVIENTIDSLKNNLQFIFNHRNTVNVDCFLGVNLAKIFLQDAEKYPDQYRNELVELKNQAASILRTKLDRNKFESKDLFFMKHLVQETLWEKPILFQTNGLINIESNRHLADVYFKNYTIDLDRDENYVDECFIDLIKGSIDLKPKICYVNGNCKRDFIEETSGTGYIRTHKLLYAQIAKNRRCRMSSKYYNLLVKKHCTFIYSEIIAGERAGVLDQNIDLLMEQIILCGYEGYSEFLQSKFLNLVTELQGDSGCFFAPLNFVKRSKRESNLITSDCIDHTTGLGAAFLALFLDYMLKMLH